MGEKSLKAVDVDLDVILQEIGIFGKYQIKTFLWMILPIMMTSLHANNYIFSAADVDYRCKISDCDNVTDVDFDPPWLGNAIPDNDKCSMYATINSSGIDFDGPRCEEDWFDQNIVLSCNEYVFLEPKSLVEELSIACEEWKRTLIGTMHSFGTLLALPIVGFISDKYGRRIALALSMLLEGLLGAVKGLSVNYAMFLAFELLEPALGSGGYSSGYILALEALVPSKRVIGGVLINYMFGISQVLLGLIAWGIPYWRTLLLVLYVPCVLLVSYIWILLESTRWLISKKRYAEAIKNIEYIAKTNGKELPTELMSGLYFNAENVSKFDTETEKIDSSPKKSSQSEYRNFFRSRIMVFRIIKCSFWWITCTFTFYGMSIYSVYLPGNSYENFIYSSLMEVPAHTISYFGLIYLGRKWTLFAAFLIGGVCCTSLPFIPADPTWVPLLIYLFGKMCVTLALACVYMYTSEIVPTTLRHSLLAACSMIGRIGSMLAPQTPLLAVYMESLPSLLFGGTCLISALLMLTSPETLGLRLPETIEEAERITELKIK